MARARPSFERHVGRVVGLERALGCAEPIDEDPVRAEVGREGKALRGVKDDRVGVRTFLARPVRSGSLVPDHRGRYLQAPILADR